MTMPAAQWVNPQKLIWLYISYVSGLNFAHLDCLCRQLIGVELVVHGSLRKR